MRIIAGQFKGRNLKAPKGDQTRPTPSRLRETVFNILQNHIEGSSFLDLFSGSGLIGFEALSRGAKSATLVENNLQSIQCIKSNAEQLGVTSYLHTIKSDVISYLERSSKQSKQFDIIYADPPYETMTEYEGKPLLLSLLVLRLIDTYELLAPGGIFFLEERRPLDIEKETLKSLSFDRIKTCGSAALHQFSR